MDYHTQLLAQTSYPDPLPGVSFTVMPACAEQTNYGCKHWVRFEKDGRQELMWGADILKLFKKEGVYPIPDHFATQTSAQCVIL